MPTATPVPRRHPGSTARAGLPEAVRGDPTRGGQTHWSITDLAQYVAAHPELGLGRPSKSTIGVILKRHKTGLLDRTQAALFAVRHHLTDRDSDD